MKKLTLLFFGLLFFSIAFCQQKMYWQQQVNYAITVKLDDSLHMLDAEMSMEYFNNSPDTLHFIWIHLWPNAYKNDRTAFSEQLLSSGRTDFYFAEEKDRGYINQLNFSVNDQFAELQDHPLHQDIVRLMLPLPLLPNQHIQIKTPFHVKLPYIFSRSGHIANSYQITQWFPKPAVYDADGWHAMPYLDQGEFYSEFGNYTVTLTVPEKYIVAATGKQKSVDRKEGQSTYVFEQERVHDFAWFADKDFEVLHDTIQLSNNKVIDAYAYFNKKNAVQWNNSMAFIKRAIQTKSNWLGEYPYNTVSVVEKAGSNDDGGMEYPTVTVLSPGNSEADLESVINHEIGHNWFYGILASNERDYPWLDEGLNSYYDKRYNALYNDTNGTTLKKSYFTNKLPLDVERATLQHLYKTYQDQPINTTSEQFNSVNYNMIAYAKTANWLQLIEKKIGIAAFDEMMQGYYREWKFKHPQPADFLKFLSQQNGIDQQMTDQLNHKGALVKTPSKKWKFSFLFNAKEADKYNYISWLPVVGYNKYDQLMPGIMVHNYTFPALAFKFFIAPLYSIGTSEITGTGRLSYTFFPNKNGSRLETSIAFSRFHMDDFTDSTGNTNALVFRKIVPAIRYTFLKKPLSTTIRYIQFKTYLVDETKLSFSRDSVTQIEKINYPIKMRYLNQLQFVINNNRKLYPYNIQIMAEQAANFIKASMTADYYFNFAKGGGMDVRFFAGKFMYTTERTYITRFETDRFHLNMTGPRGYEDYTYSDYFIGRNEFDGFASQQLMIRDGGFKVGTDLLSNKVGKTDDWLTALNITTDIPKKLNPLSLLPVKIPLKVFADIGTYAEGWKANATNGKFLFDAGIQVQLLKVLNVYWPIVYSKVYRDYFNSTITEKKFQKTLSFSIDIRNLGLQKLFPQILY